MRLSFGGGQTVAVAVWDAPDGDIGDNDQTCRNHKPAFLAPASDA